MEEILEIYRKKPKTWFIPLVGFWIFVKHLNILKPAYKVSLEYQEYRFVWRNTILLFNIFILISLLFSAFFINVMPFIKKTVWKKSGLSFEG